MGKLDVKRAQGVWPKGVSGTESRLNAQWPACSADLLTEALYVWQEHSGLWSATPMGISPSLSLLHSCSFGVAIRHQNVLDMLPFTCQSRLLFANPFGSVVEAVC